MITPSERPEDSAADAGEDEKSSIGFFSRRARPFQVHRRSMARRCRRSRRTMIRSPGGSVASVGVHRDLLRGRVRNLE